MSYNRRQPRKPIYDPDSGVPPTDKQMERMKRQATNVSEYWLNQKRMTVYEMKDKLQKKKLIEEIIDNKIKELASLGLLDDVELVEDYVYLNKDVRSVKQMKDLLSRRGLDAELIEEHLLTVDDESQREAAFKVASRRARGTVKEVDVYKRRNKVITSVISKGFSSDVAGSVTAEVLEMFPSVEPEIDEDETSESRLERSREEAYNLACSKVRGTRSKTDKVKRRQSIIQSLIRKGFNFESAIEATDRALADENL